MNAEPWDQLISSGDVLRLHQEATARYSTAACLIPTPGCVERSLGAAWHAQLLREPEDALAGLCFAGYLLFYLVENHCFLDGNKRIAWLSATHVLFVLGLGVGANDDEAEALVSQVASNQITCGEVVVDWLAEHLIALE